VPKIGDVCQERIGVTRLLAPTPGPSEVYETTVAFEAMMYVELPHGCSGRTATCGCAGFAIAGLEWCDSESEAGHEGRKILERGEIPCHATAVEPQKQVRKVECVGSHSVVCAVHRPKPLQVVVYCANWQTAGVHYGPRTSAVDLDFYCSV